MDSDLEMNRRGILGPGQRAYLEAHVPDNGVLRLFSGAEHLRGDIMRGAVQPVPGEIVYGSRRIASMYGGWFARTPDGRERDIWTDRTPLPGVHTLYVLPESGVVVGTDAPTAAHFTAYAQMLNATQGLTNVDLAAVRGHVIPQSLQPLARRPPNMVDVGTALFSFAIGLVVVVLIPVMALVPQHPPLIAMVALGSFLCGLGWFFGVRKWARVRAGARSGRTHSVDGPVHKTYTGGKSPGLHFKVAGIEVDVTNRRPLYDFVCEGLTHRLHLTDANVLVAIEAL